MSSHRREDTDRRYREEKRDHASASGHRDRDEDRPDDRRRDDDRYRSDRRESGTDDRRRSGKDRDDDRQHSDRRRDRDDDAGKHDRRGERDEGRRDERSDRKEKDRSHRSRSRSPTRHRKHRSPTPSRSGSGSGSDSDSSDVDSSEEERRRRKRKKEKKRDKESKEDRKARKERKKEKKMHKRNKKTAAVTSQWGTYGIISEADQEAKGSEFRSWLVEERKINPETVDKHKEKKEFSRFVEDYNTATLPSEKYYDMAKYEIKMRMVREGEGAGMMEMFGSGGPGGYDPMADEAAHSNSLKRAPVETDSFLNRAQLEELRKIQVERAEVQRRKVMGMDVPKNLGVRSEEKNKLYK